MNNVLHNHCKSIYKNYKLHLYFLETATSEDITQGTQNASKNLKEKQEVEDTIKRLDADIRSFKASLVLVRVISFLTDITYNLVVFKKEYSLLLMFLEYLFIG